jgi:hypothetical protein
VISEVLTTAFRQQLQLRRAELDDASSRLVQPVEARVETGVAAGRFAREREMAVQPRLDHLGFAVQPEQQQLGGGFRQVEQRE